MTDLCEYGITTSVAHYWLHVCPDDASFYVYPRRKMLELMTRYQPKEIVSARGYVVPIRENLIYNGGIIRPLDFSYPWFKQFDFADAASDHDAGVLAESVVRAAADAGLLTLPVALEFAESVGDQFSGFDFRAELFKTPTLIEVKADVAGGIWGTGNLFVQTHERGHRHGERNGHREAA
jgi:hypothetical protein